MALGTAMGAHARSRPADRRSAVSQIWPVAIVAAATAVGIGLTIWAFDRSRSGGDNSFFAIYWVGQILAACAYVWFGARRDISRVTRIGTIATYAVFNYFPKFLISPGGARYYDEFGHWQQARRILATGQLRPVSNYQPVIRDFPGLEWTTDVVHLVTRLSVWHSGQCVVVAAHIGGLLAVFGIARKLGFSDRLAVIASIVYSMNPSFQFFDAQYAYESLGLNLALITILLAMRIHEATDAPTAWRRSAVAVAVALATTITHHLSSFFAVGMVVLVLVAGHLDRGSQDQPERVRALRLRAGVVTSVVAIGLLAAYIGLVASSVSDYLGPHIFPSFGQLLDRLLGHSHTQQLYGGGVASSGSSRTLFAGNLSPRWEQAAGLVAPFLLLSVGLIGVWALRQTGTLSMRWVPFIALGALYFISLPFALTSGGAEGAHRSWGYSFLGIAMLVTRGASWCRSFVCSRYRRMESVSIVAAVLAGAIMFMGDTTISGANVTFRFPLPYQFGNDARGNTAQTDQVADWLNKHASDGTHVISDRFTNEVIAGQTLAYTVSPYTPALDQIYAQGPNPSTALRQMLRDGHWKYFVLDTHIESYLPAGPFFSRYNFNAVNIPAMKAMGTTPFAQLVYSVGSYKVFALNP